MQLSSAGPSYEQSAVVGSFGALTGQTVPHVQYQPCTTEKQNRVLPLSFTQTKGGQPCSTNTEVTTTSTATPLNSNSTPGSTQNLNSASLKQAHMHTESCATTNSQCVYTSTGSGNQATTISITETQPELVPVPGAKPQPKQLTENTSVIPEFQSGKVDAKLFRPRYYDINSLEIGAWKVSYLHNKFIKNCSTCYFNCQPFLCGSRLRACSISLGENRTG